MRELTVRLRFTKHSLANKKLRDGSGKFVFARSPSGHVIFLTSWHRANMRLAATLLGCHQQDVDKILWDINVEGNLRPQCLYRAYYRGDKPGGRLRYSLHEAFFPGDIIAINCAVPSTISQDDFWRLMSTAGKYMGLSPWKPSQYGLYEVVSVVPRRVPADHDPEPT